MDIRALFQQASRKPDNKSIHSKKRTRQVIDSDSDDDCIVYTPQSKIKANKLSENTTADNNNNNNKISPLDYFSKHSTNDDPSQNDKVEAPPVKKQRTDTDILELDSSQNTNTLIQDIGELDIDQLDNVTSPVSKIDTPKAIPKSGTPKPALSKHNSSNASAYFAYMNRSGPANLGTKEIPTGQDNCLGGLTFVLTGVMDSLERDEAKDLIVKHGGRVVGSLSKKVTHIVVGLDAGESKMEKARNLNINQINEDDLLDMIRSRTSFVENKPVSSKKKAKQSVKSESKVNHEPISILEDDLPTSTSCNEVVKMEISYENPILLADKYRPTCVKEIIGSARDTSVANKLSRWLRGWFSANRATSGKPKPSNKGYFNKDPSIFKSVLLSGPPGIGKTTTATLVCKELDLSYVEMNASSTRSKRNLQENVSELLSNYSLLTSSGSVNDKHVLIMDEVDGMAGNEDRGGLQELISLIKSSKIPIICICNDKQNPKMRSLIHYCYDLIVPRPTTDQIKAAMLRISCREGLTIPPNALEEMIVASGHDVRQVIHNISMWTATKKNLSFEEAKENAQNAKKHTALGPFEVIKNVFSRCNPNSNPIDEKLDLFFQDYSFGPLFVQENYPLIRPMGAKGDQLRHLELLAMAADSLSMGDVINKRIRGAQNWKLLPMQGFFSTVYPGEILQGHLTGRIEFPKWFGNNSKSNKYQRIVGELCTHTRLHTSGSVDDVTMDYIPSWYQKVTHAIDGDRIQEAAGFLCEYELLKEDWDSISELGHYTGHRDVMSEVAPKVKAQLTRVTNKERGTLHYKTGQSFRKLKVKQDEEFGDVDDEGEIIESHENEDLLSNQMILQKSVQSTKPAKKKPASNKPAKTQKAKKVKV